MPIVFVERDGTTISLDGEPGIDADGVVTPFPRKGMAAHLVDYFSPSSLTK